MRNRCELIDVARFFFAFCVVIIHVPLKGVWIIEPIFRCAVPFFYIVSGYFVFQENVSKEILRSTANKWFVLWLKYFVILTLASLCLHYLIGQSVNFNIDSLFDLFWNGTTYSLDLIYINDRPYGFYVIWFLLSGSYLFFILQFLIKYLNRNEFYVCVLVLFLLIQILVYNNIKLPRFFTLCLPYVVLGGAIRRYKNSIPSSWALVICLLIVLYLEWIVVKKIYMIQTESYFSMPIFMSIFFSQLVNERRSNKFLQFIALQGKKHSLYVYVYHRPFYVLLSFILGSTIDYVAAPLCFLTVILFSYLVQLLCQIFQLRKKQ